MWVHNKCYDKLPDGYELLGLTTEYGQPIYTGPEGEFYLGHDGRYYRLNDHPPTPPQDVYTLPSGYHVDPEDAGHIIGPKGGHYRRTSYVEDGHTVYNDGNGHHYIFKDGRRVELRPGAMPDNVRAVVNAVGERQTSQVMEAAGYKPVEGSNTVSGNQSIDDVRGMIQGQHGIDGIYYNEKENKYVIVETKATQTNTTGDLKETEGYGQQMSKEWLRFHVMNSDLPADLERALNKLLKPETDKPDGEGTDTDKPDGEGTGDVRPGEQETGNAEAGNEDPSIEFVVADITGVKPGKAGVKPDKAGENPDEAGENPDEAGENPGKAEDVGAPNGQITFSRVEFVGNDKAKRGEEWTPPVSLK